MIASKFIGAKNATEAWESWWNILKNIADEGFKQPSRVGTVVGEVINAYTVIENPCDGLCKSPIRNSSMDYVWGELLWYLSGSNRLKDIRQYSKAWDRLTDDGTTINSAYGHRIYYHFGFDQWEYVVEKLVNDPLSRQAVIHIKDASNAPSKDVPCTVCLQYQIRDVKKTNSHKLITHVPSLFATTYMRSNDIWLGFPYDVAAFTAFQVKLAMELGVNVGTYTHIAGSLHLYESSLKIADKNLQKMEGESIEKPDIS